MRIKVIKKTFLEFLDLIMLKGTLPTGKIGQINEKTILTALNGELIAENLDITGAVYSKVNLKRVEVNSAGQFPIENIANFVKIIKNFRGKNLEIEFDKINVSITDGTKTTKYKVGANLSELKTVDESLVTKTNDTYILHQNIADKFNINPELETVIDITSDEMKSVTADGDLSSNRVFPIEYTGDRLNINITNDFGNEEVSYLNSFEIDIGEGPAAKTTVSYGFDNIFKNIVGQVSLYFNNNSPLIMECRTKDIDFVGLLAPLTDEESLEDITEEDLDNYFE